MSTWRQRIGEQHGLEAHQHLTKLGVDDLDDDRHETILRRQWLDAVREFSPEAILPEELLVHLQGEEIDSGALDFKIGEALLKPLEDGISAASQQELTFEITGISAGSTVLRVRATPLSIPDEFSGQLPDAETSQTDLAIKSFFRIVSAAEAEEDLREWAHIHGAIDRLVEALDKFDLSLGLRWLSRVGTVRSSQLTQRGRQYVRSLRDTHETISNAVIHGRITELREAGLVKVKAGVARTSPAFEVRVNQEHLIGMRLALGQEVSFLVRVTAKFDKLGREKIREYLFLDDVSSESPEMF